VIRNRIDEFGVAEPQISSQGSDRVVVELPGIKDVDRAKDLIGRTAKLEFKMVDEEALKTVMLPELISQIEKEKNISFKEGTEGKFSEYVKQINEAAKGKIPEGSEIAFEKSELTRIPLLLKSKAEVTGNDLQDAQVSFNQESQRPEVAFELNPKGAVTFEKLTGDNVGRRLAIVLDGIVHSAPNINSKIGARGVITTGRGGYDEALRESKDLAIVLRAGALPAQLELMEQRVVGPSLGADSVSKGAFASILGILAVFLLTAVYYRISGMIAVASLLLNVILVLAILVWLEATLTLPGIAGIALTVGIAVDSNVVIYERIREELGLGKAIGAAVEAGFDKAFKTILDANVANGIAAIILMVYGSGPVKGFAVTMIIGIITTLFTAVFVCRVLFDFYLKRMEDQNAKTLSI
jgi:protein-export membrane protein SecD